VSEAFEEAFNLLCGEQIGYGMSRKVFACALLPDCVVKVETDGHRFQNVIEWETWNFVQWTPASRWFAACKWISPNGKVLIQERTRPAGHGDLPEKVPVWFTDLKRDNWGMAKARNRDGSPGREWLVCHDYGTSLALQEGTTTKRLKKADWI
jgi:hypothetical protein